MSNRSIRVFLEKIEKDLRSKTVSKNIRKLMNKRIIHSFTMSVDDNISQILTQLQLSGYLVNDEVKEIVEQQAQELYDTVKKNLIKDLGPEFVKFNGSKSFTASIESYGTTFRGGPEDRSVKTLDYFDRIKENYRKKVNNITTVLNKYYKSVDPETFEKISNYSQKGFLDLGHREGSEVAGEEARIASEKIYNQFTSKKTKAGKLDPELFKVLGIDLAALKNDLEEKSVIKVSLESAIVNRGVGAKESAQLKDEIRAVVKNALNKLKESPAEFKGSDSRLQIERKRIIKTFQETIKPNKNLKKTKQSNTKINKSSGRKQKRSIKGKAPVKGKSITASLDVRMPPKKSEARRENLLNIQTLINSKLPDVVRENMLYPRLQNRTGRFASSVKVTDITTTKQGFPSIGFTYRKNPYQIFEQGAGRAPWATSERDPRKLIDQSIREIAKGLIAGRFYTRRV